MTRRGVPVADQDAQERRGGAFDYARTAFFMCKPYSQKVVDGPFQARSKADHKFLVSIAIKRGLYLWYASVVKVNGKFQTGSTLLVDFDTVPDKRGEKPKQAADADEPPASFVCLCGKECISSSGLTLHRSKCKVCQDLRG